MGSGNFDGGGSVKWKIENKKDSGTGGPKTHTGKDNDPPTGSGSFAVFKNTSLEFTLPATKGNSIRVVWGPESEVLSPTFMAVTPKKKKTSKKAKGRK